MLQKLLTYWRLGLKNLIFVFFYRLKLNIGFYTLKFPIGKPIKGVYFKGTNTYSSTNQSSLNIPSDAGLLLKGRLRLFSNEFISIGNPPRWFFALSKISGKYKNKHWSKIPDFNDIDIKLVWEPSRFHWLVLAAQGFRQEGDQSYLSLMNNWLKDWSINNPFNQGPNWKCGQETSIRILNLLMTLYLLDELNNPTPRVVQMIQEHCERIMPTINYAIAQDNNHAVTEFAGLYVAGAWLNSIGISQDFTMQCYQNGREGLEERIEKLVRQDGSFSQHSTNYHRFFLDTISLIEFWTQQFNLPKFSTNFYVKANVAVDWLRKLTDANTGIAPNLGANDGAMLLQLTNAPYKDFRPSVQLAGVLFNKIRFYDEKNSNSVLNWFGLNHKDYPILKKTNKSELFDQGGYATFVGNSCWGLVRYPIFHFRPSHADLMHLEIIDKGFSVVRDGGSYSYNTEKKWLNYFSGIKSHNTIQFDGKEPMPKLSRFLFGSWPEADNVFFSDNKDNIQWRGEYEDYRGCFHQRRVLLTDRKWKIVDKVSDFSEKAVLRWRLAPSDWKIEGRHITSSIMKIIIEAESDNINRIELVEGWESIHYNEKTKIPVLEVEISKPDLLTTTILLP